MNNHYNPTTRELQQSRANLMDWFTRTAPLIQWSSTPSPLGEVYFAVNAIGLCSLDFGVSQEQFVNHLDPLARTEENPQALAHYIQEISEYFQGQRQHFTLPVDLSGMTPFQRRVLDVALSIPAGDVWTYGEVARRIGNPKASRAVGRALGSNPVPIVVPCHRVIASDGSLTGYSAGGGIASKKWLLQMEGALPG